MKPFADFHRDASTVSGLRYQCRACFCNGRRERYADRPTDRRLAAHQARRQNYGLTSEQFEALLCEQAGRCKVCDDPLGAGRCQMHVDHDHVTGQVRGLLCHGCNVAIGCAKDSPGRLRLMAAYLEAPLKV